MMKKLQKLGKALMLPVAALPICGILRVLATQSLRALWACRVRPRAVHCITLASC